VVEVLARGHVVLHFKVVRVRLNLFEIVLMSSANAS
jgi:hypothetical protein